MSDYRVFWTLPENFVPQLDVVGCYCQFGGAILLLKRHPAKPQGMTWCLPGGKVDTADASIAAAMQRELHEETGILAAPNDLRFFQTRYVRYPDFCFRYHLFNLVLPQQPAVRLEPYHVELCWVTPNEALTMELIPGESECLKMYFGI